MCTFFFSKLFEHPAIKDLDYYARIDTDSKIASPIRYDIFEFMQSTGFSYGYNALQMEGPVFVQGMWDFVEAYLSTIDNTVADRNRCARSNLVLP